MALEGRDVYVRITNSKGESHIREHRVWDAEVFVNELSQQGRKSEKSDERFKVELSTKAEYQKERK